VKEPEKWSKLVGKRGRTMHPILAIAIARHVTHGIPELLELQVSLYSNKTTGTVDLTLQEGVPNTGGRRAMDPYPA
jgi:hypothetical protein